MTYLKKLIGLYSSNVAAIIKEETGSCFWQLMDAGYSVSDVIQLLIDSCDGDAVGCWMDGAAQ